MPPRRAAAQAGRGFTLIEALVVLSVTSVLAALAMPSFRDLIVEQRVRAAAAALQDSLWLARSEAIKRNRNVSFTVGALGTGWAVHAEGVDSPLRMQAGLPGLLASYSSGDSVTFQYNPYGRLAAGAAAIRITVSAENGGPSRCIHFDSAARAKVAAGECR